MPRLLLLGLMLAGAAHPLHTTHTEIVERGPGEAGIIIRAFTDDLHRAVGAAGGTVTDSVLAQYVRGRLEIRSAGGAPARLSWEGTRTDGDATLLRLSATIPGGLRGMRLRQAMQMELFTDQVNVVQIRYAGRRVSLLFTPGDGARPVP